MNAVLDFGMSVLGLALRLTKTLQEVIAAPQKEVIAAPQTGVFQPAALKSAALKSPAQSAAAQCTTCYVVDIVNAPAAPFSNVQLCNLCRNSFTCVPKQGANFNSDNLHRFTFDVPVKCWPTSGRRVWLNCVTFDDFIISYH